MANTTQGSFNESSESSSIADPITPDELAYLLLGDAQVPNFLIIDCRSFMAFNANHIVNAFNAPCGNRLSRKRLAQGRATVADMISDGPSTEVEGPREAYNRLAKVVSSSQMGMFVCYDDNSDDLKHLEESHPLRMMALSLRSGGCCTKYLVGGFQTFYARHSSLCSRQDNINHYPDPAVDVDIESVKMTQILPFLFLGNQSDAANRQQLKAVGINHVINVTPDIPLYFFEDKTMTYLRIPASDNGCQDMRQFFGNAVYFIESARRGGGKVLVHCQAGVSRSVTVVIAYLIARYGRPTLDTFQLVKQHRQIVEPNINFMGQLLEFEDCCKRGVLQF